ncbi:hypothetical protein ACFWZW_03475 [Microbacterium enclense]|uniref:hypothetical protein n=1 Tax=Microbacterium enclense TaxID=993073 RepID=UPI0036DDA637
MSAPESLSRFLEGPHVAGLRAPDFDGGSGVFLTLGRDEIELPEGVSVAVGGTAGHRFALVVDPTTGRTSLLVATARGIRELAPISAELARALREQLFVR